MATWDDPDQQDGPVDQPQPTTPAGDPWTPEEDSAARAWAQQYIQQHAIPAGYGGAEDLINNYQQQRRNGVGHDQAMATVPGLLGWDKYTKPADTTPNVPTPTPTTGSAGPTGTLTGLLAPFTGSFQAPTPSPYPTAPNFTPPAYTPPPAFEPDKFAAPTFADAQNDPGYQFASDEGRRAVEQGAAAKGTLNSGGTLKDILAWGQNYAAQRYGDVYNRNYNTWQGNEGAKERAYATNYSSQFLDPYKFAYQGALDTFNPKQSQWQTNMSTTQRGNENDYANAYERFLQSYKQFQDQRDSTFDKTYKYVTA